MSLESIRARVEAATEGPWEVCDAEQTVRVVDGRHSGEIMYDRSMESGDDWAEAYQLDADFIAHARTDIPLLLKVAETFAHHRECLDGVDGAFSGTDEEYEEANRRLAEAWDALDAAFDELEAE
jgi:hypothetical protein